jgi:hypothetical protein
MNKGVNLLSLILILCLIVLLGLIVMPALRKAGARIPEFLWPPPTWSASAEIPTEFFGSQPGEVLRLCHVERRLHAALEACEYFEMSYYSVPGGFAMVTRLEQINRDGTSKEPPDRWAVEVQPLRKFSLKAYLIALFTANPGRYRIIVFIVSPHPFSQADVEVSRDEAIAWLGSGLDRLPDEIGQLEYTERHKCTALIYEFDQSNPDEPVEFKEPSDLQGRTHLVKAKLWEALGD